MEIVEEKKEKTLYPNPFDYFSIVIKFKGKWMLKDWLNKKIDGEVVCRIKYGGHTEVYIPQVFDDVETKCCEKAMVFSELLPPPEKVEVCCQMPFLRIDAVNNGKDGVALGFISQGGMLAVKAPDDELGWIGKGVGLQKCQTAYTTSLNTRKKIYEYYKDRKNN